MSTSTLVEGLTADAMSSEDGTNNHAEMRDI